MRIFDRWRLPRSLQSHPYFAEFGSHWPNLIGACIGVTMGSNLSVYLLNLFGPPLLDEFGWQKSQFALASSFSIVSLIFMPIAGRFIDRFGSRVAGIIGYSVIPLCFLLLSMMSGNIMEYYLITLAKLMFGVLTSSLVFGRVIVQKFDSARGMALSIMMCGPPLAGAIAAPIIGAIIEAEGWRVAFQIMAAASAIGGVLAILLIEIRSRASSSDACLSSAKGHLPLTWQDFKSIVRNPVFGLLVGGMFLINIPQVILSTQMKLVLFESGAESSFATWLVSVFAMAVIVGRFASGYALDRVPPHIVGVVTLGLPAFGLLALASPLDAGWLLFLSIALTGMAQGAESDVGAVLTSRKFDLRHYSFIFSFTLTAMSAATAIGSIILSAMLHYTDRYNEFLLLSVATTLAGAICFYLTGKTRSGVPVEAS